MLGDILHRVAGVDDVLDNKDVTILDGATQILEYTHFARAFHGVAIAADLQEIDLNRQINLAHQISNKNK